MMPASADWFATRKPRRKSEDLKGRRSAMTRLHQVLTSRKAFDLTAESDQLGQTVGDTGAKLGTSNSGRQGGTRTVCGLSAL